MDLARPLCDTGFYISLQTRFVFSRVCINCEEKYSVTHALVIYYAASWLAKISLNKNSQIFTYSHMGQWGKWDILYCIIHIVTFILRYSMMQNNNQRGSVTKEQKKSFCVILGDRTGFDLQLNEISL